jgi:hypothetical protein
MANRIDTATPTTAPRGLVPRHQTRAGAGAGVGVQVDEQLIGAQQGA